MHTRESLRRAGAERASGGSEEGEWGGRMEGGRGGGEEGGGEGEGGDKKSESRKEEEKEVEEERSGSTGGDKVKDLFLFFLSTKAGGQVPQRVF